MRIGICDDCETDRILLKKICNQYGHTDIILYHSGEDLLADPNCSKLELLFLDIEMDGQNGLEVKNILELTNTFTLIVFCTSHTECVMDAFGANVISFLQKPFTDLIVERCLKKALYLRKDFYPVAITTDIISPCCNILYIHAEKKYSIFYSVDNSTILSRKSLQKLEEELSSLGFCSISRSYIVNLKHVKKIEKTTLFLSNHTTLTISRRYLSKIIDAYHQYQIRGMRYEENVSK